MYYTHELDGDFLPFNLPTPLEFRVLAFGGVAPEK
jgi:hypothetical protein